MTHAWHGFLRRDGDGIYATMVDAFGMVTEIRGTPATVDSIKGYAITARLAEVPAAYAVPLDGEERITIMEAQPT